MLSKIKSWLAALCGVGAALFAILFFHEKAKRLENENEHLEAESEALSRVSEALVKSEKQLNDEIATEKKKPVNRAHFSKSRKL